MSNSTTSTTRARSIPNSSKYLKGGNHMSKNYDALNGMYDQIETQEMAYYNKLFEEGGNSMDNYTALNGMYNQYDQDDQLDEMYEKAEMEELMYYEKLFEGEEESDNGEELKKLLNEINAGYDEDHYRHLKEVHEKLRGLSS